jgi:hypothetical protein
MEGAGGAPTGLGRFKVKGPSEDDEPGRSREFRCKDRFRDSGASDDDCDNVRECLDACDLVNLESWE